MLKPRRTSADELDHRQGGQNGVPVDPYFDQAVDPFAELERLVEETRASLEAQGHHVPPVGAAPASAYERDPFGDEPIASSPRYAATPQAAASSLAQGRAAPRHEAVDWDEPFDPELLDERYDAPHEAYGQQGGDPMMGAGRESKPSLLRRVAPWAAALVVLGGAFVGYKALNGDLSGAPKVISAPAASDLKEVTPPMQSASKQADVFDTKSGSITTGTERIVPRNDTTALPQTTADGNQPQAVAPDNSGAKKVRTVIMRADGSIVEPSSAVTPPPTSSTAQTPPPPVDLGAHTGTSLTTVTDAKGVPPVRPDYVVKPGSDAKPTDLAAQAKALPSAKPPEAPTKAPTKVAAGSVMAQLSSQGSDEEARRDFAKLQKKFPEQLRGQSLDIQQADVKGKTYFRVRVGPFGDRAEAKSFCEGYKGAGGKDCIVSVN